MKNRLIILMIFLVPLAVFAVLQYSTGNAEFKNEVQLAFQKGKLLKFHSPMCTECKEVKKNVESAMKDYKDEILLEDVDVTQKDAKTKDLIETYKVTVVPTVIFINKNGKISAKKEGAIEETEIRLRLEEIK